jgi:hypothetical protein
MTETITHIALQRLNGPDKQAHFQSLKGITLSLDERKCLVIEAPHLPEKIVTNDLVELLDENKFIWLGRWDNVINTGGVKIIPEIVEPKVKLVLDDLSLTKRFFLAGLPDEKLGSKVVLFIEGEESVSKTELIQEFVKNLSKYEIPKEVYFIPRFIETSTQKINRIETIRETSFVKLVYWLAYAAIGLLCGGLIFMANTRLHEAIFFIVVISLMMIFLINLISDLDNPFGNGDAMSVEDVSLDVLTSAVKRMQTAQ